MPQFEIHPLPEGIVIRPTSPPDTITLTNGSEPIVQLRWADKRLTVTINPDLDVDEAARRFLDALVTQAGLMIVKERTWTPTS